MKKSWGDKCVFVHGPLKYAKRVVLVSQNNRSICYFCWIFEAKRKTNMQPPCLSPGLLNYYYYQSNKTLSPYHHDHVAYTMIPLETWFAEGSLSILKANMFQEPIFHLLLVTCQILSQQVHGFLLPAASK